jgi:hypothetical protein
MCLIKTTEEHVHNQSCFDYAVKMQAPPRPTGNRAKARMINARNQTYHRHAGSGYNVKPKTGLGTAAERSAHLLIGDGWHAYQPPTPPTGEHPFSTLLDRSEPGEQPECLPTKPLPEQDQ